MFNINSTTTTKSFMRKHELQASNINRSSKKKTSQLKKVKRVWFRIELEWWKSLLVSDRRLICCRSIADPNLETKARLLLL